METLPTTKQLSLTGSLPDDLLLDVLRRLTARNVTDPGIVVTTQPVAHPMLVVRHT